MARLPQLVDVAKKFDMKLISIEDLVAYRMKHDSLIQKKEDFDIQTKFGTYRLRAYLQVTNKQVHIALTKGVWNSGDPVLTRINSSQVNNDILEMAEWSIAAVLKTVDCNRSGGSNPSANRSGNPIPVFFCKRILFGVTQIGRCFKMYF